MANETQGNSATQRPLLTPDGRARLEARLRELIEVERPKVAEAIHEAKEAGDISESSAYEHAKNEQARVEGEIRELTALLNQAGTLELTSATDEVRMGATVTIRTETGKERAYTIVSTHEANPQGGYISTESPVGKALLGHKKGDKVVVTTPNGDMTYTIVKIG
jgi:transcription elongation factor GreA